MESDSSKNTTKSQAKKSNSPNEKKHAFPIVAIGASAGGLEAVTEILKHLPPTTGMAFIYVQHLSPDHKSLLTSILTNATAMKVQEISDMDEIKPDNVYIIPNDKGLEVTDGHLKLISRSENSSAVSIDIFFSSLAKAHKQRVIGILLSGSGWDGTAGLKNIKQEGGLAFAQDDSARFTSMPNSAIDAGAVDFILSPQQIANELTHISNHPHIKGEGTIYNQEDIIDGNNPDLKLILQHLHKTVQVDFSSYKTNTIIRRIMRRMLLYKLKTLKEYRRLLMEKSDEAELLHQDLLINVTSFFRDAETHKYLKSTLFPKLLKNKNEGETLRIWTPACSTGEEVYSIAMLLLEIQSNSSQNKQIQIFATDLSKQAINKARIGIYSPKELETVSPKRLQRFFTKSNQGYKVNKELRQMCAFALHNILTDPPFSRIDFISCCNLFIYLDSQAQKSALNTFHYALNEAGYLMLGKSEMINSSPHLFTAVSKSAKIFLRKKNLGQAAIPALSINHAKNYGQEENSDYGKRVGDFMWKRKPQEAFRNLDNVIDDMLVSEFMPTNVAINKNMEIVQFRGATELYLKHPKGKATYNILKMALPEIAFELRNTISQAIKTKSRIKKTGIEIKTANSLKHISIEVLPLKNISNEQLYLIVFTEQNYQELSEKSENKITNTSIAKDRRIKKLEEELAAAHNAALEASQEQEAFIEELQSANEEVVSSNEELQTVNEELQTSKEEIESANEELITTNQELQVRNIQLNESYDYSAAITDTINEPMVVLDKNLRVKSANRSFYSKFNLAEEVIDGELLFDLGNKNWNIPRLRELLENIISKNSNFDSFEITHNFPKVGEKTMLLNARRLYQKSKSEHLILLAFQDVTEERTKALELKVKENEEITLKAKWEAFKIAQGNMHNVFLKAPAMICILKGPTHVYELMNDSFKELIAYRDIIGKPVRKAFPELADSGLFELLDQVYKTGEPFTAKEKVVQIYRNDNYDTIIVDFVYQPSLNPNGDIDGILVYASDVTEQVLARKKIEESAKQFTTLANGIQILAWMANPDGWIYWYNDKWYEYTGSKPEEMEGWGWEKVHDPEQLPLVLEKWAHSINSGEEFEMVFPLRGADSIYRPFLTRVVPLKDQDGKIIRWIGTNTDISKQKEIEDQFRQVAERMPQKVWTADAKGNRDYFNQVMLDYTGIKFEELKGWGWKKIIHPDDWSQTELKWEHSIRTGEEFEVENRLLRNDGAYLWHLVRATAIKDQLGEVKMWVGSNTEIHKQIELVGSLGENLQESDERMRTILQQAPDSIISIDEEGIIKNWNSQSEKIFGWKESEVIGKKLSETIIPERYREAHESGMKHYIRTGEGPAINQAIELSALKKDGGEFPVELKISTTKVKDGYMFIGFIRDISVRKRAEETIITKTNQLIEAQALAHIGSWEWDVRNNKLEWSDELYRIYGLVPQEIEINFEIYQTFIHPSDKEYLNGILEQAFQDHQPFNFFHQAICADGAIRTLSASGKVFTDEDGNVIKMSGTAQDVTEQKKFEEELRLSEDRFYKIFDRNPIPMTFAKVGDNKIKYANTLFFETFGYTKGEVIGKSSEELNLIDPVEYQRVIDIMFENLQENRSLAEIQALAPSETEELLLKLKQSDIMKDFEILYTKKNGDKFPVIVSFELVKIDGESFTVTSYQDITERKKADELLQNQNEQLEKMNRELESFVYVSSHDLQEPLRKIQTFATLIAEKELQNLSESGKDKFQRIQNAAFRMQNLIQDLLAYSRTKPQERNFEMIEMGDLLEEVKSDLAEELQQKNATIELGQMCKVKVIAFQFRQLIFNLISNSLKFSSEKRPPHIKVNCEIAKASKFKNEKLSKGLTYCHIQLADNGIGFEQEYSNKIFEVFQRLHGKEKYEGTGIGLAIVKKIVENHNGIITATGTLDKGATFDIYFPVK